MHHHTEQQARAHALQSLAQLIRQPSTGTLEALAHAPEANAVRHCLALAHLQSGHGAEGRAALDAILHFDPNDPVAGFQLAVSLERDGLVPAALQHYEMHVARHPAHVAAWHNLGLLRLACSTPESAVAAFAQVVGRDAAHFNGWMAMGAALHRARRTHECVEAWLRASALRPQEVEPLRRAASALGELAELPRAIALLERGIALAPCDVHLRLECASHCSNLGAHAAALGQLREARRLAPNDARVHSALLLELQYGGETIAPEALAREHWEWGALHADGMRPAAMRAAGSTRQDRRLRIGYLSPRFGIGPLAPFFLPVLEQHDRRRFDVRLFAAAPASDPIAQRMRAAATAWHDLPADDDRAAALIASEELDLLVDLAGHSPGHRLSMLARRPAPVQATWLDYFDTTGTSAIDYLLGDPVETPGADAAHFRERLVLLPCRFAYRPLDTVRATALPAGTRGHVTFGSFNRHAKISDATLDCWAEVLHAIPDARLVLRAAAYRGVSTVAWLREQWARRIPVERIDFMPWLPWQEALAAYSGVDVALDPFPYNGGLTTCDALAHGVPVVALAGDRMIARQSAALLRAAGRAEWIAEDRDDYVRVAVDLARDPNLARIRADLQARLPASALCDVAGFTRRLEQAFETMASLGPRAPDARHPLEPIAIP